MKTVFIYVLKDPETGEVRYVGKSIQPKKRFRDHLCEKTKTHRVNWFKSLASRGLKPIMEIEDEAQENWEAIEAAYIQFFREQGCKLVNGTEGGEDPPACWGRTGEKHPNFGRKGMKSPTFGQIPWNKGGNQTAEHKAKISAAIKAHWEIRRARANSTN